MDYEKFKEFSEISSMIMSSIEGLLKAQDLLVDMMCDKCDIPKDMKPQIIQDINKSIYAQTTL